MTVPEYALDAALSVSALQAITLREYAAPQMRSSENGAGSAIRFERHLEPRPPSLRGLTAHGGGQPADCCSYERTDNRPANHALADAAARVFGTLSGTFAKRTMGDARQLVPKTSPGYRAYGCADQDALPLVARGGVQSRKSGGNRGTVKRSVMLTPNLAADRARKEYRSGRDDNDQAL